MDVNMVKLRPQGNNMKKYQFKCYICEETCKNRDKGGVIGNNYDYNSKIICKNCVHTNYCWATDDDLKQHNYTELENRRKELSMLEKI